MMMKCGAIIQSAFNKKIIIVIFEIFRLQISQCAPDLPKELGDFSVYPRFDTLNMCWLESWFLSSTTNLNNLQKAYPTEFPTIATERAADVPQAFS